MLPQFARQLGTVDSSVTAGFGPVGRAFVVAPGGGIPLSLTKAATTGEISVLALAVFNDFNGTTFDAGSNNSGAVIYSQRTVGAEISPTLCVTSSAFAGSSMRAWFGTDTNGVAHGWAHSAILQTETLYCIAASLASGGDGLVAVNGSVESNAYTQAGSFNSGWSGTAIIGSHEQWPDIGARDNAGQELYLFARWARRLTAPELASVTRNPWQLFAPMRRGIVVPAASGTTIAGGIGTATATGLQASIAVKTAIAGGIGTATASGLQASIALRTNIAAGIGTASATGLQASIAIKIAIAGGIGTATASGLQATITVGSGITINGGIGTATASGLQASISAQTTIQGGIGTAAASGLQATIGLRTPISGGIGTASASGLQAALTFPTSITAGIGEASASGLPAGITFPAGGTIIFGVGSATASGLQALIREIGVSGGASVRGKKRGWANERAALEESLRQVDRIAEVMAESDEPQAQAIAEELEDYSGEVEQIELLRERLQALQAAQRRKEMTAQKERDVQEAARELKAILDDDEEIAGVLDSMLHIEFRALRMIGVM